MSDRRAPVLSGGCQCGAVRYALYAEPFGTHICHCRMCQKAFGAFYAPLTLIRYEDFAWTRGEPAAFRSSPDVERGYCADCGTPLTFARQGSGHLDVSVGSLDRPERVKPESQIGIERRLPWMAELAGLPEQRTDDFMPAERLARIESFQHPDNDTEDWPAKE